MKKYFHIILIVMIYILSIVSYLRLEIPYIAMGITFSLIVLLFFNKISCKFALCLFFVFILGIINCNLQIKQEDILKSFVPSRNLQVVGTVESVPVNRDQYLNFFLIVNKIKVNGKTLENVNSKILIKTKDVNDTNLLKVGDVVSLEGFLFKPFNAKNPSQFDYSKFLQTKNVFTIMYVNTKDLKKLYKSNKLKFRFLRKLNDIRDNIIKRHSKYIKSPNLELLGGIVFGDDAVYPPKDLKKAFINSGLAHLIAASGLNVGIIFTMWYFLANYVLSLPYRFVMISSMFVVLLYTSMTGFPPSILRATIMIEFVIFGKIISRKSSAIKLLFITCFLMTVFNPIMLKDIGFQLSFIVTFGIILSSNIFLKIFDGIKLLPGIIIGEITTPIIAQIFVTPLQMFYFNQFSLVAIIANILVIPFIFIVSSLGFFSCTIAAIPFIPDKLIYFIDLLLNPLLSIIVSISYFLSKVKFSIIYTFKPSIPEILAYYCFIISTVIFINEKQKTKITSKKIQNINIDIEKNDKIEVLSK